MANLRHPASVPRNRHQPVPLRCSTTCLYVVHVLHELSGHAGSCYGQHHGRHAALIHRNLNVHHVTAAGKQVQGEAHQVLPLLEDEGSQQALQQQLVYIWDNKYMVASQSEPGALLLTQGALSWAHQFVCTGTL